MSILAYNGGSVVAMVGDGCVGIASDTRFGVQAQTVGCDMKRIFKVHDRCLIGLSGMASDVLTVKQDLKYRTNMYKLREQREIKPKVFNSMVWSYLYSRRFGPYFVEPLVVGLCEDEEGDQENPAGEKKLKPFISGSDLIGAPVFAEDFVVCGTAEDSLYGTCETFYKPGMNEEELFETLSQCLLSAVDRDCLSGWGGEVHILTPTKHIVRTLKGRHD